MIKSIMRSSNAKIYTSTLIDHLKRYHDFDSKGEKKVPEPAENESEQIKEESAMTLSRMIARRLYSINQLYECEDTQLGWKKRGLIIPRNREKMRLMVI